VDFGGGLLYGTFNGQDAFLAKYSSSGQHVWSKGFWGDSGEEGTGVAVDGNGNVVLTGKFQGGTDLGGGTLSVQGSTDFYVAQFTSAGVHRWSRAYGGGFPDASVGVAVDGAGEILGLGSFSQTIDLGGGVLRTASTDYDVFLANIRRLASMCGHDRLPGLGTSCPMR
jgi:hypothetical protein